MELKKEEYEALIAQQSESIYNYVRGIVKNHDDANDVVQSAFMKAWTKWETFRGQSARSTWLFRIASNEAFTLLRRNKKHIDSLTDLDYEPEALPYFDSQKAEQVFHLAIENLPPRQRAVFDLKYFEELSFKEIAEILDVSVGSLKASYHHAVKKIKMELLKLNLH